MTRATSSEHPDPIILAVWQVMAESGMGAVSMRTVAAAADVSVGRIQYRFRTKEDLVHASLAAMIAGAAARHGRVAADVDTRQALWSLLSQSIPRDEDARVGVSIFYQYVAAAINHPGLAQLLSDAKDGAEQGAAALIARVDARVADPRAEARALIATADGLAMRVLLGGLPASAAERALRSAVAAVVAG